MPEIKNVLVTAYIKPENQKKLEQALAPANVTFCVPYGPGAKEKIAQAAKGKDVCILNGSTVVVQVWKNRQNRKCLSEVLF